MIKLLKYAILGLLMLDVAVLPFSCYQPSTDDGSIYVWIQTEGVVGEDGYVDTYVPVISRHKELDSSKDYQVGDVITAEMVNSYVDQNIDKTRVASYEILGYKLYSHDDSIKTYIELPYTLTEEAIIDYVEGIRSAFHIVVVVDFEYIVEEMPEDGQVE